MMQACLSVMASRTKERSVVRQRRSQEERSAQSRAKLLASAIAHIGERGLAATNMVEIAANANLTRGAIQHHFSNRPELILAVIAELDARLSRQMDEFSLSSDVTGIERVELVLNEIIKLTSSPDAFAIYDIWSASRSDPALGAKAMELQAQLTKQFRDFWFRNISGHIPDDTVSTGFAITLLMSQGAGMANLLGLEPTEVDRMLQETKAMLLAHLSRSCALSAENHAQACSGTGVFRDRRVQGQA